MYQCIFLIFLLASNGIYGNGGLSFITTGERELERKRSIIFFFFLIPFKNGAGMISFLCIFFCNVSFFFFSPGRFCFFRGGYGAREQMI